jgi:hypothetical protein
LPFEEVLKVVPAYGPNYFSHEAMSDERDCLACMAFVKFFETFCYARNYFIYRFPTCGSTMPEASDILTPKLGESDLGFLLGQPFKDAYISLAKGVNHCWTLTSPVANDFRSSACALEWRADYRIHTDRQCGTQFRCLSDALGIQAWIQCAKIAVLGVKSSLSMTHDE